MTSFIRKNGLALFTTLLILLDLLVLQQNFGLYTFVTFLLTISSVVVYKVKIQLLVNISLLFLLLEMIFILLGSARLSEKFGVWWFLFLVLIYIDLFLNYEKD